MLPDPSALRSGATVLGAAADQASAGLARVGQVWGGVLWHAPVADAVGRELAAAEAAAAGGQLDLQAGAAHLRVLAAAVEDLQRAAVRLHDAAEQELRADAAASAAPTGPVPVAGPGTLALAPPLAALARAQADLVALPSADDPSWAPRAGACPVALPARAVVGARPVAASPPGLVEADTDGVRRLGAASLTAADALTAVAARAVGQVHGLGLQQLDAYGLAGSRSAAWLLDAYGPGSGLDRAAAGWVTAGRRATLLAGLLEAADEAGALLADPRLGAALDMLAQLRGASAPDGPADLAWLAAVLGPTAPDVQDHDSWLAEHGADLGEAVNEIAGVPGEAAAGLRAQVSRLAGTARDELTAARGLTGQAAADARAAGRAALDKARRLRGYAEKAEAVAGHLHVPGFVTRLNASEIANVPVLRSLSWMDAIGAGVGVVQDWRSGASLGTTAAHLGTSVGTTLVEGAAAAAVVALLPAGAAIGLEIAATVAVTWAVGKAVDAVGPAVAHAAGQLGSAAVRAGGDAVGAVGATLRGVAEDARPALAAAGAAVTAGAAGAVAATRDGAGRTGRALESAGARALDTAEHTEHAVTATAGSAAHAAAEGARAGAAAAGRLARGLTGWRRPAWL